jgi:hypothetical protein
MNEPELMPPACLGQPWTHEEATHVASVGGLGSEQIGAKRALVELSQTDLVGFAFHRPAGVALGTVRQVGAHEGNLAAQPCRSMTRW